MFISPSSCPRSNSVQLAELRARPTPVTFMLRVPDENGEWRTESQETTLRRHRWVHVMSVVLLQWVLAPSQTIAGASRSADTLTPQSEATTRSRALPTV